MLIIDNKIVIAHMKKCGGTSVCKGLIETLPAERIQYLGYTAEGEQRSAKSRRKGGLWKHSTASEIVSSLKRDRGDLTVYLVSLRPWQQRVASFYHHARRYNAEMGKYKWVKGMSFSKFLRSPHVEEVERLDQFCKGDSVDFFVRYSDLSRWYEGLLAQLNCPMRPLPTYNVGSTAKSSSYLDMFSAEDLQLMSERFAAEDRLLATVAAQGQMVA